MADDGNGGTATADVTVFLMDQNEPPLAPTVLTLGQAGPSSLALSWTAQDNTGRPEITGYTAQFRTSGGNWVTRTLGAATSATLTGLEAEAQYEVQVRAENAEGAGAWSMEKTETTTAPPSVTVANTTLTVAEENATGDSYTVVLATQPTADVTVTVAGHAGTEVSPNPSTLTFTTMNWETAQTVTVTAADDADATNDSVTLTHSAASADADYDGITVADVTVNDNDNAQVMGVMVAPGNSRLAVNWTAVDNATGYKVQWKSGVGDYNTGDRQASVNSGSTMTYTIPNLINDTEYTVKVIATRTGANDGPPSEEVTGTPATPRVTVSTAALTVTEEDANGDSYTVVLATQPTAVTLTVAGHVGTDATPNPSSLTFTRTRLGNGPDGDGDRSRRSPMPIPRTIRSR